MKIVMQDIELVVPKYFVGVRAESMRSYDPISSMIQIESVILFMQAGTDRTHRR